MPEKSDGAWYIISVAAEKADVHEQTLRHYERLGLIAPARKGDSPHSPRLYSDRDIDRVVQIRSLMQDLGVNLARRGVRVNALCIGPLSLVLLRDAVNRRWPWYSLHRILFKQFHRFLHRPFELRIVSFDHVGRRVFYFYIWRHAFVLDRPLT